MEKRSKLAAGQAPISASAPTPSELQSTDLKINFSLGKFQYDTFRGYMNKKKLKIDF